MENFPCVDQDVPFSTSLQKYDIKKIKTTIKQSLIFEDKLNTGNIYIIIHINNQISCTASADNVSF